MTKAIIDSSEIGKTETRIIQYSKLAIALFFCVFLGWCLLSINRYLHLILEQVTLYIK